MYIQNIVPINCCHQCVCHSYHWKRYRSYYAKKKAYA
eukprot:XP_001705242.1 Hypothetical protein GL50803_38701 [Giardia lamblia ATCC 50803]